MDKTWNMFKARDWHEDSFAFTLCAKEINEFWGDTLEKCDKAILRLTTEPHEDSLTFTLEREKLLGCFYLFYNESKLCLYSDVWKLIGKLFPWYKRIWWKGGLKKIYVSMKPII